MGACSFETYEMGHTPKEAFENARSKAQRMYGQSYSGTIGEKGSFEMILIEPRRKGQHRKLWLKKAMRLAYRYSADADKYGPAGCIELDPPSRRRMGRYLFVGCAAS